MPGQACCDVETTAEGEHPQRQKPKTPVTPEIPHRRRAARPLPRPPRKARSRDTVPTRDEAARREGPVWARGRPTCPGEGASFARLGAR